MGETQIQIVNQIQELVGKSLDGFAIQPYTEVAKTNVDGVVIEIVGYFRGQEVAEGYANRLSDQAYYQTRDVFLLTDGKIGFLLAGQVNLLNDEEEKKNIIEAIFKKLTLAERRFLGI